MYFINVKVKSILINKSQKKYVDQKTNSTFKCGRPILCQDRLDPVYNQGQDSAYANPFIELAPVLDATPEINSCSMITTNKNTHI